MRLRPYPQSDHTESGAEGPGNASWTDRKKNGKA